MENNQNSKEKKKTEKKLKGFQKIGQERIYKLFELVEKTKDSNLQKRYLTIAIRIGKKCQISIPKELKTKYCKKCLSTNIEVKKEKPFTIITCKECNYVKKLGENNIN
jgi:ribonuclease P protein subunit RPR2